MRRMVSALRGWWNRHALVHPLVAGALVLALQPIIPMGPVDFAGLGPGESVEVRHRFIGCFGSEGARITFTGTDGGGFRYTAAVSESEFRGRRSGRLPPAYAAQLDLAMRTYRSLPRERYCTNTERVVVTRYMLGWPVARESFKDQTCGQAKDAVFWDLLPPRG